MPPARLRVHAVTLLVAIGVLLGAAVFGAATGAPGRAMAARPVAAQAAAAVPAADPAAALAASSRQPQGARCRGLVALTFDDGPAPGTTERLVRLLTRLHVPATFFMVGQRVAAAPATVRTVAAAGFVIGNHTWAHKDLALQSAVDERVALLRTRRALRRAGVAPSDLMRPPYGALDARATRVVHGLGLVPVLWTVDSLDWQSGTADQIAHRILSALRPGPHNIVLQHDGVDRSPISVRAVPTVVRVARRRGYCFVPLNPHGRPSWPAGYHTSPGAR